MDKIYAMTHTKVLDNQQKIILASASPRRRDLLESIGLPFTIKPANLEETPLDGESPGEHVTRLALEKGRFISAKYPDHLIIAADTVVVLDKLILGKPESVDDAIYMLSRLQSRTHEVFTGYAIIRGRPDKVEKVDCVRSLVKIRSLSLREIKDYVSSGEPMDKAGAYAIQGIGAAIVERVDGSYTNVVGLPLSEVAKELQDLGIFDFLKEAAKK